MANLITKIPKILRAVSLFALAACLYTPVLSQARDGDDWVLVERYQSQLKLAQGGNADAMYEVARMYERGRGTEPSMAKAIDWYERAMSKGQNNARAHLGVLYFEGEGVKRDVKKAIDLLSPAANAGNPTAQYYLGYIYEQGEGLHRDANQAMLWYRKAANGGNYLAVARLNSLERASSATTTTKRSEPVNAPRPADSPATVLLQTVMNTKWQRNGRPTGFLPSSNSTCNQTNRVITCQSGEQKRNTGDAVITYVTESTLSGFTNSDQFKATYYNNVHKVDVVERPSLDGETPVKRRPPNIKLGKQSLEHKLSCELESVDKMVCIKDNSITEIYTRGK
ncbi:MAG: hypothetical protein GC149_03365 [Gammaproteobacteria bacterium]|nr:hypothetical protein [Gammaproteobacteria bacterium]